LFGAAQKAIIRDSIHAPHMTGYLFIVIGAVLVNNVVFGRILGLCPFMGVSKKLETAVGMGAATTFVLTVAAGASYLIDRYLLARTASNTCARCPSSSSSPASCSSPRWSIQKTSPLLHQVLGIYLPLITTNCAVLGVPLLNVAFRYNLLESLLFGFGSAARLLAGAGAVRQPARAARGRRRAAALPRHGHRHDHGRAHEHRLHGFRRAGQVH
jgi:electron transport complex protein RnfA